MDSDNETILKAFTFGVIVTLLIVVFGGGMASYATSFKWKTIESKVVLVVPEDDWYVITFANGESYRISTYSYTGNVMDLDKTEHLIVKLVWSSGWLSPNNDDVWGLSRVLKW